MATVKIMFRKSAKRVIEYVCQDLKPNEPIDSENCPPDGNLAIAQFKAIRDLHSFKEGNEAVHIIQSWSPEESKKLTPESVNSMGRSLVEKYFEGHQFLVVTHTDRENLHNHIVVNTVNMETGRRIPNKKAHLYKLRDISDQICLERGLTIPNQLAKEREKNMPEKVKRMVQFNKNSYIADTTNKADFARKYATSYDEYAAILGEFGITVRVENKNISYFYGDRTRAKRGSKLGKKYDKAFLEATFKENDELFRSRPDLRASLKEGIQTLKSGNVHSGREKDYGAFTKSSRSGQTASYASDRLKDSIIPLDEIKRARESSIFEYCKKNKISLIQNDKGQTVLKGREYVALTDREWINSRNKTRGTLIEFVAQHHNLNFLQAIAKINNNPRLLLLEKAFGGEKSKYSSFYIPKKDSLDYPKTIEKVGDLLKTFGVNPNVADNLVKKQQVIADKNGVIKLFPMGEVTGSLDFVPDNQGSWSKKVSGSIQNPFFSLKGTGKKAFIFQDPFTFLKKYGTDSFSQRVRKHGVLVLLESNSEEVDKFLGQHSHVKDAILVPPHDKPLSQVELDIFNTLKKRYEPLGISFENTTLEKALKPDGRGLHI